MTDQQQQSADLAEIQDNPLKDNGTQVFMVGGKPQTLKFSAAARFRLFLNVKPEAVNEYVSSDSFKLRAIGLLLFGKEILTMDVDTLIDKFEAVDLSDEEQSKIYEWVLERTVNFMLREAESQSAVLEQAKSQVTQLSDSLTGQKT